MMEKVQAAVIVVLAASLGVLTSQLMDARRRIELLEQQSPSATKGAVDVETDAVIAGSNAANDELAQLRARLARLEARAGMDGEHAPLATARVGDAAAPDDDAEGAAAPEVHQIVRKELEKAEAARDDARNERARARVVERVNKLAEDADLSAEQKQKMTDMLDAESQEMRQLFRDVRDTGDFSGTRDQVRAIRSKTDENAKAVLDEEQLAAYQAMREEDRSRFFDAVRSGRE